MPNGYHHLKEQQRYDIYELLQAGKSKKEIAQALNVHVATIYREIKRNAGKRGYRPQQA